MQASAQDTQARILVADIGGTNARLAIATLSHRTEKPALSSFLSLNCADFTDFDSLIAHYLAFLGHAPPAFACLALAGPVKDGKAHLTNIGWPLEKVHLEKTFHFKKLLLVNDFEALARSVPVLQPADLLLLHGAKGKRSGPFSIMGPGTGFGSAILVAADSDYKVLPTEAGHMSFVPSGDMPRAVWSFIHRGTPRVTVETLLSGAGIMRLYTTLCQMQHASPSCNSPREISERAFQQNDGLCLETLSLFSSMLGDAVGDIALVQGAFGGIFLGGGILPQIAAFLAKSDFRRHYLNKAPMEAVVNNIPVHLIKEKDAALYGAALLFSATEQNTTFKPAQ